MRFSRPPAEIPEGKSAEGVGFVCAPSGEPYRNSICNAAAGGEIAHKGSPSPSATRGIANIRGQGVHSDEIPSPKSDVAKLLELWTALPIALRAGIMAIVESVVPTGCAGGAPT
jgi:hypothetical protein